MTRPVDLAKSMIREQADALLALAELIGPAFHAAVSMILRSRAPLIVTGIGKSGLIARKAAATLSSTGTRAVFMHPVEGLHGDLGVVGEDAVLLVLSRSGHTEELIRFVSHFRRIGGRVIAVCALGGPAAEEPGHPPEPRSAAADRAQMRGMNAAAREGEPPGEPAQQELRPPAAARAPLVELAEVVLPIPDRAEAGPLALAPTTSTLLMLALCDALAMALLEARGFDENQFARFHPNGSLGRRLLTRASDLMHGGPELAVTKGSATFNELLLEMTGKRLGMSCIVDDAGGLVGVFTDGDLRRLLMRVESPGRLTAAEAWRQSRRDPTDVPVRCSTVLPTTLAVDCLRLMRESAITVLVISEDGVNPVGLIRLQDLVRAGLG